MGFPPKIKMINKFDIFFPKKTERKHFKYRISLVHKNVESVREKIHKQRNNIIYERIFIFKSLSVTLN